MFAEYSINATLMSIQERIESSKELDTVRFSGRGNRSENEGCLSKSRNDRIAGERRAISKTAAEKYLTILTREGEAAPRAAISLPRPQKIPRGAAPLHPPRISVLHFKFPPGYPYAIVSAHRSRTVSSRDTCTSISRPSFATLPGLPPYIAENFR